jgi:hypothetical protein
MGNPVPRLTLRARLFFSHLLVLVMGLLSFIAISKISSLRYFVRHLETLEGQGVLLRSMREVLLDGFQSTWTYSTLWALMVGAIASALLSYWVAYRINRPLDQMETIAHEFATGHLHKRIPPSHIPELARLGRSLNQMAGALEDAEQKRRDMVTDLSHELRTPLTVIRGYLEEIASGTLEATPDIGQRLSREARRLERLVNDLQDLSQAEAGSLSLTLRPLTLQPLLQALIDHFASQVLDAGPTLQLQCPADLPPVLADCDRTEQILVNLLGNALRHTQRGRITLAAWREDRRNWLAVTDTGSGIAAADLPYIFDRFWRAAEARSRYSSGTGVGLAITRQLVELQGGEIFVESQLGQGSCFRFWLPRADTPLP